MICGRLSDQQDTIGKHYQRGSICKAGASDHESGPAGYGGIDLIDN